MNTKRLGELLQVRKRFLLQLVILCVGGYGLVILATVLLEQFLGRLTHHGNAALVDIPLLYGISLIYLSSLLQRRKRTAWGVTLLVFAFVLGTNVAQFAFREHFVHDLDSFFWVRSILVPLLIVGLLAAYHKEFVARSDIRGFGSSLRFVALILLITIAYGVAGFMLTDKRDFHQEIGFFEALHRTVDQFNITTSHSLTAYTHRARLFMDSLSFISTAAVVYAIFSFFQPLKARYVDAPHEREALQKLLENGNGRSEDFFKLWPHDKVYLFNEKGTGALAYKVQRGVALVVGDPACERKRAGSLLKDFDTLCLTNDWLPAFIHTEPEWREFYEKRGFELQKIGQEAILDIEHFEEHVRNNKYFRHIQNKFTKLGFAAEVLQPPHSAALLARLKDVSSSWLDRPGRTERGFMMGYFNDTYLQTGAVIVVRDAAGTIQAFLNQIPSFDRDEANFDFLRHTHSSPGNINDFTLMAFIGYLHEQGVARLNLGLCPLAGLETIEDRSFIDTTLQFLYANGDRLYSFKGLYRFKSKYEPMWSDRFIAYKGGLRGLSRTVNALNQAMKIKLH